MGLQLWRDAMKWHFASVTSYNLSTISYDQFLTVKHKAHVRKLEDILQKVTLFTQACDSTDTSIDWDYDLDQSKISRGFYWAKREHM